MSGRVAQVGRLLVAVLLGGFGLCPARAGDVAAAKPDDNPDKSAYTLFNPVPENLLRDFNPDRPSQFTSGTTVDAGHFQLEMDAVNYTRDRNNPEHARVDVDQWNVAPFDLRVGLTQHTEIDFLYGGYINVRTRDRGTGNGNVTVGGTGGGVAPTGAGGAAGAGSDTTQSGFGDLTLLFKYNLFGNDSGKVSFGILPYLKIPTNTDHLGNKHVEGGVELPLSINLPANFNLSLQTEFDALRNDADTRYEAAFTNIAYLGYTFLGGKFTVYGEWYSRVNQGPDSEVDGEVDGGLIYYIGKNAEVDVGCNFGVTRAAADYHPFTGLTVRF